MIEATLSELALTLLIVTGLVIGLSVLSRGLSQRIHHRRMASRSVICRACSYVWCPPQREKQPTCPQCQRPNRRRDQRLN